MKKTEMSKTKLISLYKKFIPLLKNSKIDVIIFYGTLLGYIRENDFIDKDDDIDILIPRTQLHLLYEMVKINNIQARRSAQKGLTDEKTWTDIVQLYDENVGPLDIYIYEEYEEDILIRWDGNLLYSKKDMLPFKNVNFYDQNVLIPNNSHEILKQTYGNDYMIPRQIATYIWDNINNVRKVKLVIENYIKKKPSSALKTPSSYSKNSFAIKNQKLMKRKSRFSLW